MGRATSCQVLPEYSIPLKPDNYLMITREPPEEVLLINAATKPKGAHTTESCNFIVIRLL